MVDAAALLAAMSGADTRDSATRDAKRQTGYVQLLDADALRGARIGVARGYVVSNDRVRRLFTDALETMKSQGAEIVDPVSLPPRSAYGEAEFEVQGMSSNPVSMHTLPSSHRALRLVTLAELIEFNEQHQAGRCRISAVSCRTMAEARGV